MKRFSFFSSVNFVRKHFATLGVLGLLVGSWLFMYYFKTEEKISKYKNQIHELKNKEQQLTLNRKSTKKVKQSIRELKSTLHTAATTSDTKKDNTSKKITSIARKIQKLGLNLNSCTVQDIKNKQWLLKQNVTYNLSGKIEQIEQLINKIQKKEKNLKCKKLFLTTTQDKQAQLELVLQFLSFKKNISS